MTTHIALELRLRKHGAIPPLPHTTSWNDTLLSLPGCKLPAINPIEATSMKGYYTQRDIQYI
jgi:hypothetical protein